MNPRRARRPLPRRPRVEPLEPRALPSVAGTLDPTFGAGGIALSGPLSTGGAAPTANQAGSTSATAVGPDGKVVLATYLYGATDSIVVERFDADGSIDAGFGRGGRVSLAIPSDRASINSIQILPGGQIDVVAGAVLDPPSDPSVIVVQLGGDGTPDPGFGTAGMIAIPDPGDYSNEMGLNGGVGGLHSAVAGDGKLLLSRLNTLTRLDLDGSPDPTFGRSGTATLPMIQAHGTTGSGAVRGVAAQASGRILVSGTQVVDFSDGMLTEDFVLALNPDGSPDYGYGGPGDLGIVLIPPSLQTTSKHGATAVVASALGSDGKLVLLGTDRPDLDSAASYPNLIRLNPDGTLDPTFGDGGVVTAGVPQVGFSDGDSVAVQSDGKIVVATPFNAPVAGPQPPAQPEISGGVSAYRYNVDGTADASFATASPRFGVASTALYHTKPMIYVRVSCSASAI